MNTEYSIYSTEYSQTDSVFRILFQAITFNLPTDEGCDTVL